MTNRQSAHSHECWSWGPAHYECAVRKIETLASELRQAKAELDAAQAELAREKSPETSFTETGTARLLPNGRLGCLDCGAEYGGPRFPDLVLPHDVWAKISPNGDEGGLLCPCCINARLAAAGISNVFGRFVSGPLAIDPEPSAVVDLIKDAIHLAAEAGKSPIHAKLCEALDLLAIRDAEARELGLTLSETIAREKELRAELARVRELAAKWRAAPQDPDEPLLAMAADELEAALSQPAEQHDPLAVSDHCGECGPERACDERESLPLMARREWMFEGAKYAYRNRDSVWFQSLYKPGRAWEFCYRIADTDEHGLKVVPREPGMPEWARYRWPTYGGFAYSVEFAPWRRLSSEVVRIEDYRESGQEGKK